MPSDFSMTLKLNQIIEAQQVIDAKLNRIMKHLDIPPDAKRLVRSSHDLDAPHMPVPEGSGPTERS